MITGSAMKKRCFVLSSTSKTTRWPHRSAGDPKNGRAHPHVSESTGKQATRTKSRSGFSLTIPDRHVTKPGLLGKCVRLKPDLLRKMRQAEA